VVNIIIVERESRKLVGYVREDGRIDPPLTLDPGEYEIVRVVTTPLTVTETVELMQINVVDA
jgi:hypothetical protein